jgi:hypothetical protein
MFLIKIEFFLGRFVRKGNEDEVFRRRKADVVPRRNGENVGELRYQFTRVQTHLSHQMTVNYGASLLNTPISLDP